MMDEKDFEKLWERAEGERYAERLVEEYPGWRTRRRKVRRTTAAVAAVVVVGISIFNYQFSIPKGYDGICCNRTTLPDSHWAQVAEEMLVKM